MPTLNGSNTKAFTTAALATLVDEGKISWDDPIYQRPPGFQMYDPYVAHEMTIRDLLTHRSGYAETISSLATRAQTGLAGIPTTYLRAKQKLRSLIPTLIENSPKTSGPAHIKWDSCCRAPYQG
jgi:CubicO group peptidase (beta-lactamase class C family)